jgi:hypothetical protein
MSHLVSLHATNPFNKDYLICHPYKNYWQITLLKIVIHMLLPDSSD